MKAIRLKEVTLYLFISLVTAGCAANFNSINPHQFRYPSMETKDSSVVAYYKYDILTLTDNKKYAKKEGKNFTNLVAIKIDNNTNQTISTNDFYLVSNNSILTPLSPKITKKTLKQKGGYHLFYLLLTGTVISSGGSGIPIGLVLGPGLTLFNWATAASANQIFGKELIKYTIEDQTIPPQQSAYFLVGIQNEKGDPIYIKHR